MNSIRLPMDHHVEGTNASFPTFSWSPSYLPSHRSFKLQVTSRLKVAYSSDFLPPSTSSPTEAVPSRMITVEPRSSPHRQRLALSPSLTSLPCLLGFTLPQRYQSTTLPQMTPNYNHLIHKSSTPGQGFALSLFLHSPRFA